MSQQEKYFSGSYVEEVFLLQDNLKWWASD